MLGRYGVLRSRRGLRQLRSLRRLLRLLGRRLAGRRGLPGRRRLRRRLDDVQDILHHNHRKLRTCGHALRVEERPAVDNGAGDQALGHRPGHGRTREGGHAARIRKRRQVAVDIHVAALEAGVLIQDRRRLLAGRRAVGIEPAVADAGHDVVARRPEDRLGIPGAAAHVGEGVFRLHRGLALETIEDLDDHGAGELRVGLEGRVGRAGKELVRHDEVNAVVRPVGRGRHIGEFVARAGFTAGARDGRRILCTADGADTVNIVVRGGDDLLCRQRRSADGALAAFGQAGGRAGRRHGRERLGRVGLGRDGLGHRLTDIVGVNARAGGRTGRLLGHDARIPRVVIHGAHLRDARGEPVVHVGHGIGIRRAGRPVVAALVRIADADERPLPVVHGGAGREARSAGHDLAVVPHKLLRLREERIVIVIADGRAEAGDLQERGHEVAAIDKVVVRADIAVPAAAAGRLHIPDGAGVHDAVHVFIEEERGIERVGVAGEALHQVSLDQRGQIAVLIVVLAGLRIVTGVVAIGILRIDGVLKLLIVLADIRHGVLAAPLGALDVHRRALTGDEAAGLVILRLGRAAELCAVEFEQVAAGDVGRLGQAGRVPVGLAVPVLGRGGGHVAAIARVDACVGVLHVGDVHAGLVDSVLLTDEIGAAVDAVIVQIHPVGGGRVRHAQRRGKILKELVVKERCVVIAGQQRPGLDLFPAGDEVALLAELDLIGLLLGDGEGGVAARLELRECAVIDSLAVLVDKQHLRRCNIGLAGIDKVSALCGRIVARDVERAEIFGLRHAHGAGRLAVDENGEGVEPVVRIGKLCDVHGLAELFGALAALQLHGRIRAILRVHRQGELVQVRACGQEQILRTVRAQAGDGPAVHPGTDRAEQFGRRKRAVGQRRHLDLIGVVRRGIPLAVHLRAAKQAEGVLRCGREARDGAGGLCGHGQNVPGAAAVTAHLDAVVFRTGGRRPLEADLLLADLGRGSVPDAAGQDLILGRHGAVEIAHALDRDGAEADARVVCIVDVAVNVHVAGLDRQLLALIRDRDVADGFFAAKDDGCGPDLRVGNILAFRAALRADVVLVPTVALIPDRRAAVARAAILAGGKVIAVRGAGAGVDRLRNVGNSVVAEVIHLVAELLPAGDIVAGQEVHLLLGALDGHPAGVLCSLHIHGLAADRAHGLAVMIGRQLVAARAAGLQHRGIDETAVLAVVGRDGHGLVVGRDIEDQALIALLAVGVVKIGADRIVLISGLLAQVAADEIGHAVFGDGGAVLGHDARIGVVMAGKDRVDAGGLCRGRDQLMELLAAAVFSVGIVWRLVDGQDLPHAGTLRGVLLEPFAGFGEIRAVVDDGDIDIAVLHGIVVLARELEQIRRDAAAGVTIILVIAKRMEEAHARERGGKGILHFRPHGVVGAVVHIVAGLQAEIDRLIFDDRAELFQHRDACLVLFAVRVAGHLRVAHDDEGRGVLRSCARAEALRLRPGGAVADPELIIRAGRQARELRRIGIGSALGRGEAGQRAGPVGRLPGIRALDTVLHDRLAGRTDTGQPADALRGAAAHGGVEMDAVVGRAAGIGKHRDLRRLGNAVRSGGREHADRAGRLVLHGVGLEQTVGVRLADLGAVHTQRNAGRRAAVLVIDGDHAGHAGRLRTGNDGVIRRQRQTHRRLCRRVGRAVGGREHDAGHRVGKLVDQRVERRRDVERQLGQLALDRRRRLEVQRQHGFLKAGLRVFHLAGHAGGIRHVRLADIVIELQHGDVRRADLPVRRDRECIVRAERNKVGAGDADRRGICHRRAVYHKGRCLFDRVAERIGHGDRHGVLAVLERQTHGRVRVGIVRLDRLAVDLDGRGLCVDAGAVLPIHIVVLCHGLNGVGSDDRVAAARERRAVDRHLVDDRVIQIVEVRAVDNAVVIEVKRAVFAAGIANALVAVRLIGHPNQAAAAAQADRVLRIAVKIADVRLAVHPAGPGDLERALRVGILRGQARIGPFIRAAGRIPGLHVRIHAVCRRALGRIYPNADLRRRAGDVDVALAAVANVEIDVGHAVVGAVVVVELHRVLAEADLAALRLADDLQVAAAVIIQCAIWPQEIVIAVIVERLDRIPVAADLQRRLIVRILGDITAVGVLAVVGKRVKDPVVVRTLLAIALRIGLKVEQGHRQLADLDLDLRRLGLVIGIRGLDRHVHGLLAGAGGKHIVTHAAGVGIAHALCLRGDRPPEVAVLIDDVAAAALGDQAQIRRRAEVQRRLCAAERQIRDVRNGHGRAAGGLAVNQQLRRHLALIILRGRKQAVGVNGAALAVRHGPGHIVRQLRMAAVFVHADGRESDLAVGRIHRVVRREGRVIKHAVLLRRGDQQQRARDRALHAIGRAVADGQVAGALALRGIGRRAAAVEVDRIHNALRGQKLRLLIHRHTDGVGTLAAVGHKGHDRAVGLEADAVDRYEIIAVMIDLAVLDQITRPGNGLQHVGAVRSGVTDGIRTVLQNSEIRLGGSAVVLLNDVALHDEVAERLRILHVVEVAVHGHDDVAAGRLGVGRCLQRCLFQVPGQVRRRVLAGRGRAAFSIITAIRSFESCLRTRCDRRHKAGDLRVAFLGVQENVRFRHTVDQRIVRLADDQLVAGGLDGFIRSQCLRADQCQHHNGCQQKGPGSVCEAGRIHVSQHSLLLLSVLLKIIKKKR